ncbi:hypothetical protein PTSG_11628 [Salpingoeca rosetta]|uniref:J domain-containing protein n=1 Tax=Salpingoeca rosetta (strain ATCC 50818 / BSB-021) TaxID=946362 RepID=F2TX77_SALR5|nr:uncharacterized protein PTSG_11628 [Salpingoeca rosetta]EGD75986.1 hypothetical protein PTSG_11628 [Salpingoeca rosetta]|eukprot:XP_004998161.1 hypothetical protein PTSG_11628 [Salpingoeca rosetta]
MERVRRRPVFPKTPQTRRIKVLTLGCTGVGKSCLIKRYCERRFVSKYLPTIGIDYGITVWQPAEQAASGSAQRRQSTSASGTTAGSSSSSSSSSSAASGDALVRVNFFDTSGDDVYYSVRNEFYEYTQGILLVFDVNKRRTFERLNDWLEEMSNEMGQAAMQQCCVVVCANKVDVEPASQPATREGKRTTAQPIPPSQRAVSLGEAQLWAESHGYRLFETSAQTGNNVAEAFHALFAAALSVAGMADVPANVNTVTPRFTKDDLDAVTRVLAAKSDHGALGIGAGSDAAEVQRAFRALAGKIHPDKNQAPGSDDAFKRVLQAKDALLAGQANAA